jgi:hypothetical protein
MKGGFSWLSKKRKSQQRKSPRRRSENKALHFLNQVLKAPPFGYKKSGVCF